MRFQSLFRFQDASVLILGGFWFLLMAVLLFMSWIVSVSKGLD